MREYIILQRVKTFPVMLSSSENVKLVAESVLKKSFTSYDEAVRFSKTLDYGVTIYEAVAEIKIKHEVTKLNENTNSSTSKPS